MRRCCSASGRTMGNSGLMAWLLVCLSTCCAALSLDSVNEGWLRKQLQKETGVKTLIRRFLELPKCPTGTRDCEYHSVNMFRPLTRLRPFKEFIAPRSLSLDQNNSFYPGYPYINGLGFKLLADFCRETPNLGYFPYATFATSQIFNRSLIYWPLVFSYHNLQKLRGVLRNLLHHIFLMTHNQDAPHLPAFVLDSPKVLKIFVVNGPDIDHPKVVHLPLGLRAYGKQYALSVNEVRATAAATMPNRTLHARFGLSSIAGKGAGSAKMLLRKAVLKSLRANGFYFDNPTGHHGYDNYLREMTTFNFVLSPPGSGRDAHRTWEALGIGRPPVIANSTPTQLHDGLPVVLASDWNTVTPASLELQWEHMKAQKYNLEKLFMPWWVRLILFECLLTP
eukprot:NODE_2916_length_1314_cov_102.013434_g2769_i0.p1 GENE.NODE_2916_length_1314_cov_102.013434_g2769_i0~~NODE_2916_length_1314_cov_102.013434_g2769_i0.p1  ORF type:complete len:411 (-),score=31.51 NODE_2916_length_1314_cov_102.013434_g2769_i0:81-1259(-)